MSYFLAKYSGYKVSGNKTLRFPSICHYSQHATLKSVICNNKSSRVSLVQCFSLSKGLKQFRVYLLFGVGREAVKNFRKGKNENQYISTLITAAVGKCSFFE